MTARIKVCGTKTMWYGSFFNSCKRARLCSRPKGTCCYSCSCFEIMRFYSIDHLDRRHNQIPWQMTRFTYGRCFPSTERRREIQWAMTHGGLLEWTQYVTITKRLLPLNVHIARSYSVVSWSDQKRQVCVLRCKQSDSLWSMCKCLANKRGTFQAHQPFFCGLSWCLGVFHQSTHFFYSEELHLNRTSHYAMARLWLNALCSLKVISEIGVVRFITLK